MPRGTVLELLGAPASGKSGLAAELAGHPGVAVVKDHAAADLPALGWALTRSPRVVSAKPQGVSWSRWFAWAGRLGAVPQVARRRMHEGAAVVLLDQGPAYTLGRIRALRRTVGGDDWWASRIGHVAMTLDLLVLLEADVDTLVSRLRGRHKQHVASKLGDHALGEYLRQERATCRFMAEVLGEAGVTVLRLDTAVTPLAEQAAAVLAHVGQLSDATGTR